MGIQGPWVPRMSRFCADHRTNFLTYFSVIRPPIASAGRGGCGPPAVRGRCGGLVGGGWESSRAARAVAPRAAEPSETAVQNRFYVQICALRGVFYVETCVCASRRRGGDGETDGKGAPTGPPGPQRGPKGPKGAPTGPQRGPNWAPTGPNGAQRGPAGPQRGPARPAGARR